MVRLYGQDHLDLLLLAVIGAEPGDGAAVMRGLYEHSGRRFDLSPQLAYRALHRLERNRLVQRSGVELRRYELTASGRRLLNMKRTEWESFATGVQAVLRQIT